MTLLRSYLRPKVLYQLVVTTSPSGLSPLNWDIDKRRLGIIPLLREMYPPKPGDSIVVNLCVEGYLRKTPLVPIQQSVLRNAKIFGVQVHFRQKTVKGTSRAFYMPKPSFLFKLGSKKDIIKAMTLAKEAPPLITTAGQDQWTEDFGTQWRELWKNMNTHTSCLFHLEATEQDYSMGNTQGMPTMPG